MIAGMVMLEDVTVHFRMLQGDGPARVVYTVVDGPTGAGETREVDAVGFMAALGMGMQLDGEFPEMTDDLEERMRMVQPENPLLRFIP